MTHDIDPDLIVKIGNTERYVNQRIQKLVFTSAVDDGNGFTRYTTLGGKEFHAKYIALAPLNVTIDALISYDTQSSKRRLVKVLKG